MDLPLYQIDAFAERAFTGNPAAVMPLPAWLPDEVLAALARENNLSETAFLVREGAGWALRWFTPAGEIDLCGHATLASACVVMEALEPGLREVTFSSRSGPLGVRREGDLYVLDFPVRDWREVEVPPGMAAALGAEPRQAWLRRDLFLLLDDEGTVRDLAPDMGALARQEVTSVVVTAPGRDCHFVSRCFAPREGIPEDPVTGSTHCVLVPWWARRLGGTEFVARQLSARGGELRCRLRGDRVDLAGRAVRVLTGTFHLPS